MTSFSRTLNHLVIFCILFSLVLGVGFLQYSVPYEVSIFPLYLIPIALVLWHFGNLAGFMSSLMATIVWIIVDVASGRSYTHEWYRYQNAATRFIIFFGVVAMFALYQRTLETHRARMEAMRAMLNVCHGCGAVQGSEGNWIPFDELVSRSKKQSCECPRCSKTKI